MSDKLEEQLKDKVIPVLYGGFSAEREVSLNSGRAIHNALCRLGAKSELMDYPEKNLADIVATKPDLVFIALHGRGGEDGTIQGALDSLKIPYTGSGVLASALAMDKYRCKLLWKALGLPTAPGRLLTDDDLQSDASVRKLFTRFGPTLAIKPSDEGSSVGVFKVQDAETLLRAAEEAKQISEQILVESWVSGEEYTVGVVGSETLPSIRLQPAKEFYDFEAKYLAGNTQYHCPSGLSDVEERELQNLARKAFESLDCKGWGRVDFIRDKDSQFFLLEVNTIPGMTETSLVPKAAAARDWSFEELVKKIVERV